MMQDIRARERRLRRTAKAKGLFICKRHGGYDVFRIDLGKAAICADAEYPLTLEDAETFVNEWEG